MRTDRANIYDLPTEELDKLKQEINFGETGGKILGRFTDWGYKIR